MWQLLWMLYDVMMLLIYVTMLANSISVSVHNWQWVKAAGHGGSHGSMFTISMSARTLREEFHNFHWMRWFLSIKSLGHLYNCNKISLNPLWETSHCLLHSGAPRLLPVCVRLMQYGQHMSSQRLTSTNWTFHISKDGRCKTTYAPICATRFRFPSKRTGP